MFARNLPFGRAFEQQKKTGIEAMEHTQTKTKTVTEQTGPIAVSSETRTHVSQARHATTALPEKAPRGMRKLRFVFGMLLTGSGIALILSVAAGAVQAFGVTGRLSLPAVGLCMIVGVMLLGGGFGVMATSAATFENDEFERLMADNRPSQKSTSA